MSNNIIHVNQELIQTELKELVRNSVEETLNAMLDAEADKLVNAERYARDEQRKGYRSGHYDRSFTTTSGDVTLRMPKLRGLTFETSIIERYKRRETSVEEALIEMYLAGVSVRRVEDITEALWGSKVSPGTISNLNKKAYEHIEAWRNRPLAQEYPYVFVDGIYLKRSWGGEFENCSVLIAIGVNQDGYREILGACEGLKEDTASWKNFFVWLKERGLTGVKQITGDKAMVFPSEHWSRIRTNNTLERLNKEIRRRTRVVGTFPDGESALMLVCARLRYVAASSWGEKRYLNMVHLRNMQLLDVEHDIA